MPYADPERGREASREYKRTHRERAAAWAREARRRKREGFVRPTTTTCRTCGVDVVVEPNGLVPIYCSRACSPSTRDRVHASRPPKPKIAKRCQKCGAAFETHATYAKWCSRSCAPRKPQKRPAASHTCRTCGDVFVAAGKHTWCVTCLAAGAKDLAEKEWKRKWMTSPSGRESKRRQARNKYQTPSGRERAKAKKRRREYRARGASRTTPYDRLSIFQRDGWRCHLCARRVDPLAKWPDQMCASIDHLIPLSAGGADSAENVRLAHWLCNVRRGDGGGAQLLLIA